MEIVSSTIAVILAVVTSAEVFRQCRKPRWFVGRLMLSMMNLTHAGVTKWGIGHLEIKDDFTILDIGCGGGKTIARLASIATKGKVFGVDYSSSSVAASRRTNSRLVSAGRVEVQQASVSELPFSGDKFDIASAVETHYY